MPDRLFGGAVAVLSILFLAFAVPSIDTEWQSGTGTQFFVVGPQLFPNIAGSLTLLFGVLIALQGSRDDRIKSLQSPESRRSAVLVIVLGLVFVALLNLLGFLVSAFLTLCVFLLSFGERRLTVLLPVTFGVPVVVYLVFLKGFSLELPAGPIDFLFGGL